MYPYKKSSKNYTYGVTTFMDDAPLKFNQSGSILLARESVLSVTIVISASLISK